VPYARHARLGVSLCLGVFVVFFSLFPSIVRADEVTVANGDVLTGEVIRLDGRELILETEFAGEIRVRWDAVRAITTDQPVEIQTDDGRLIRGRLVPREEGLGTPEDAPATGAGDVTVATGEGIFLVPAGAIRALGRPRLAARGYIELGYAWSLGNSHAAHSGYARGGARIATEKTLGFADGLFAYGREYDDDHDLGRREAIVDAIAARRLAGPIFVAATADFVTDTFRRIEWRTAGGGSAAYFVQREDLGWLLADFGPVLWWESIRRGDEEGELAFRAGLRAESAPLGPLTLEGRAVLFESTERLERFRTRVLGGARFAIWRGLYAAGRVMYQYEREPALTVRRHDTAFEAGLGWSF
jgi:hypothetical protein